MQNQPKSRVTIKDVARACGVSTQTISRVINKRSDVSQITREKILAVIAQMGYQPSALAQGMRQGSKTFGVIVTGLKYKGISTSLNGIVQSAEKFGYSIILKELATFGTTDMHPLIESLIAQQVQGIIYAAPEIGDNWSVAQKNLTNQTPPMIFLKGNPLSSQVTISIDNYRGAYLVTQHLIEQGFKNIGHISGPLDWWEARERKRGWAQALSDGGFSVNDKCWIEGDWSSMEGAKVFRKLQQNYPDMDSVFAANDQTALAVLHVAGHQGLKVPLDLGVVGYDNVSESKFFSPSLTTIQQDFFKLGDLAVRKLIQLKSKDNKDKDVIEDALIITPKLVIRDSSMIQDGLKTRM